MKILSIRRAPLCAGTNVVAHFDVEITPEFRVYCLSLREEPGGGHRITAPNAYGRRVATFTKDFAIRLTAAAVEALKELNARDNLAA